MHKDAKRIEDMQTVELARQLRITETQAAAIQDFIRQSGGIQEARDAVDLYGRLTKAA
jgi:hypothetical protein